MAHEELCPACEKTVTFWERDAKLFCSACGMGKEAAPTFAAWRRAEGRAARESQPRQGTTPVAPSGPSVIAPDQVRAQNTATLMWMGIVAGLGLTVYIIVTNWDTPTLRQGGTGEQFMTRLMAKAFLLALALGAVYGFVWLIGVARRRLDERSSRRG